MRWPPTRGSTVVAAVTVGLGILVGAGRLLALHLAEPTPTGTVGRVSAPIGVPPAPAMGWSMVPAAPAGKSGQLAGDGVRLRLPGGWQGRTSTEGGVLVLQAANFSLAPRGGGEDPIKAMGPGQVVVTVSTTGDPATPSSAAATISASDFAQTARAPAGQALAEKTIRTHGRMLHIEALFGARQPAALLLAQTNQLLASLTVI